MDALILSGYTAQQRHLDLLLSQFPGMAENVHPNTWVITPAPRSSHPFTRIEALETERIDHFKVSFPDQCSFFLLDESILAPAFDAEDGVWWKRDLWASMELIEKAQGDYLFYSQTGHMNRSDCTKWPEPFTKSFVNDDSPFDAFHKISLISSGILGNISLGIEVTSKSKNGLTVTRFKHTCLSSLVALLLHLNA